MRERHDMHVRAEPTIFHRVSKQWAMRRVKGFLAFVQELVSQFHMTCQCMYTMAFTPERLHRLASALAYIADKNLLRVASIMVSHTLGAAPLCGGLML